MPAFLAQTPSAPHPAPAAIPAATAAAAAVSAPAGFTALSVDTVAAYVAARPALAARVGPVDTLPQWTAAEIGDGNINFVYLVQGPVGGVIVKQGLPYVRVVGEGWPLSQVRSCIVQLHRCIRMCVSYVRVIGEGWPLSQVLPPTCGASSSERRESKR